MAIQRRCSRGGEPFGLSARRTATGSSRCDTGPRQGGRAAEPRRRRACAAGPHRRPGRVSTRAGCPRPRCSPSSGRMSTLWHDRVC